LKTKIDVVFVAFTSIAIFLLMYLVYNILNSIQHIYEIVKLLSLLISPLPIALFLGFISSPTKLIIHENTTRDKITASVLFVIVVAALLLGIYQYDRLSTVKFGDLKILPLFLSTLISFAYVLNHLSNKNLKVASVLSGLLLGLAIYFFT
jgi:hypothetical protein